MPAHQRLVRTSALLIASASTLAMASPAYADCALGTTTNANDTLVCVNTVTTDTVATTFPTVSRDVPYSAPVDLFVQNTGAITGYGLALTQNGTDAGTLNINNTGAITLNSGIAPTVGGTAALNVRTSGASVSYTGAGTITATDAAPALRIDGTSGTTPLAITVNTGGAITSAGSGVELLAPSAGSTVNATFTSIASTGVGATALYAETSDGALTLNTGVVTSAGNAVEAVSTTGPVIVNVTGDVSTTGNGTGVVIDSTSATVALNLSGGSVTNAAGVGAQIATSDVATVTVAAGETLSGSTTALVATSADGNLVVNNSGTISGPIAIDSNAQTALTNATGATVSGALVLSDLADTVTNNGTLTLSGASDLGLGADVLTNNGTATLGGTLAFGDGADTLANGAGDTLDITGTTDLGLGDDVVTNAATGTVSVTGSLLGGDGADSLTNAGAFTVASGGTLDLGLANDTITNSGTLTLAGTVNGGDGIDTLANQAGGTVAISGTTDLGLGADVITNAATGTVNVTGSLLTGDGTDAVTNSGTFTVASGGTVNLGLANDTLTNNGTLTVTGSLLGGEGADTLTNSAGATTSIAGVLDLGLGDDVITNAGTFAVTGAVNLGDGADSVTNSGTYTVTGTQDFGAGTDSFSNTGTLNVSGATSLANLESFSNSAAGVVNLASGATLTGSGATSFTNAGRFNAEAGPVTIVTPTFTNAATGIIDMQDGANGDVTTITGAYVGTAGSQLLIDANADLTAADRLVVSGNISGNTTVGVNYLGTASTFNPTGVVIVDGGGTTAAGSFTLNPASVNNGLLTYSLTQNGADVSLVSNFNVGVTGLAPLARMGTDMWYQSFDAYHDGIAGRHGYANREGNPIGVWANLYLSRDKWGETSTTSTLFGTPLTYSSQVENHRRGAQGGIDIGFGGFTVGVTGGYAHNKAENGANALYDIEGYNYGAYAIFGSEFGLYGAAMYKHDDYDVRYIDNGRAFGLDFTDASSDGFDGELGFRAGGENLKFDLNAGASWVKTDIAPATLYGATFSYDDAESLRGRLGARVIMPKLMGAFIGAKVFHEFKGDNEALRITSGALTDTLMAEPRGTTYRLEAGLGGDSKGGPVFTIWGDFGDTKGIGGRLGFRF